MFRIKPLVYTAFLLLAGETYAAQEDSIRPIAHLVSEDFENVMKSPNQKDSALGRVGDYVVGKSDIDRMLGYYPAETRRRLEQNPAEVETLVKRMLEVKVVADWARREKFDRISEIRKQLAYVVDDFISREYLEKVVMKDLTISDADLKEFYTQNKKDLAVPEQVRARHILIKVDPSASVEEKKEARARADTLLDRLKAGEDFENLAETYSEDPSTKTKGGDLGYFPKGQMVTDFEDVAFYTNPGEISGLVTTKYGYHIVKVEDHIDARERSFDEVKDFIKERLQKQLVAFKVEKFIREAAESAGMQVYSDKIQGK